MAVIFLLNQNDLPSALNPWGTFTVRVPSSFAFGGQVRDSRLVMVSLAHVSVRLPSTSIVLAGCPTVNCSCKSTGLCDWMSLMAGNRCSVVGCPAVIGVRSYAPIVGDQCRVFVDDSVVLGSGSNCRSVNGALVDRLSSSLSENVALNLLGAGDQMWGWWPNETKRRSVVLTGVGYGE